jgi:hypothetical protein
MHKNLHLWSSAAIVLCAGIGYGGNPSWFMHHFFGVPEIALGTAHILRAIMGLYAGLSVFWLLGTWKADYWRAATWSNVLFMGGISIGRMIALIADGFLPVFAVALVLEALYGLWGWYNLGRYV